jgi:hypothetical protein
VVLGMLLPLSRIPQSVLEEGRMFLL